MKLLTTNQVCAIIILVTIGNKLLSLPGLMYGTLNTDALWIVLLNFIGAFFIFYMFAYICKKYPNVTFKQFITKHLGNVGYVMILVLFTLYYLIKLVLTLNEGEVFLSETIYVGFSSALYIIPMSLVAGFFVYKGVKVIARTNEMMVKLIVIGLIITIGLSLPNVKLDTLLPLFVHSADEMLYAYNHTSIWFGSYFMLFIFMGKIELSKNFVSKVLKSYLLTAFLIFLFFVTFYSVFGPSSIVHQFAVNDVVTLTPQLSSLIKIDWFTVFFYSIALILNSIIQLYFIFYSVGEIFKVKNSKSAVTIYISLFTLAYLLLPYNTKQIVQFVCDTIGIYASLLNLIVPLIIFIVLLTTNKEYSKQKELKFYGRSLEKK